ncbi:MAG TPA: hypothetical protein VF353_00560, partial [Candidatus Binatia bacterium]
MVEVRRPYLKFMSPLNAVSVLVSVLALRRSNSVYDMRPNGRFTNHPSNVMRDRKTPHGLRSRKNTSGKRRR